MRALPFVVFLLFAALAHAESPPSPVEEADPNVKIDVGRLAVEFAVGTVTAGSGALVVGGFVFIVWFAQLFTEPTTGTIQFVGLPMLAAVSLGSGLGVYGGARFFTDRGSVWAAFAGGLAGIVPALVYTAFAGPMEAPEQWAVLGVGAGLALAGAMIGFEISHARVPPWYAPRAVAPFRFASAT